MFALVLVSQNIGASIKPFPISEILWRLHYQVAFKKEFKMTGHGSMQRREKKVKCLVMKDTSKAW
jgi:hypothetical protein